EVYLAQHPRLPRQDALKVLPAAVSADQEYRARFHREADIAATLWHPHIVGVHDRGESEGQLWISMDYVEGTDAARLLEERYPNGMPPDEVVRIITAVAEALDYAHQRQLLHRDVKPANILIAQGDSGTERILLADFGIARWVDDASGLTGTNMTVGTVAYAAPEQLMGEQLDGRADQYALAATAYHLLTGTPLFQHSNPAVVISQHLSAPPPPIGTRRPALEDLGPVFCKALSKAPEDRYDTCIDFASALGHRLGTVAADTGATEVTTASPIARRPRHRSRRQGPAPDTSRRQPAVIVAAVLALLLIGVSAFAYVLFHKDETTSGPSAPNAPILPVVAIGADCATLSQKAQTTTGQPAYCSRNPVAPDNLMWSTHVDIATPSVIPAATDEVYPSDIESQVRVCVEETGQTRQQCREDIRRSPNVYGNQ
ncbi:MAG TPA: serine/threonine-protein kinase, partial [Mycobacterium sp.]|nr:serine/threonine-protein kinase [Mycobacterium sp.]